jgi:rhodanese-related sulfurtransferase
VRITPEQLIQEAWDCSPDELAEKIARGEQAAPRISIIDVRDPDQFNEKHIPGATFAEYGEQVALFQKIQGSKATRPLVFVCERGVRSWRVARLAARAGLPARTMTGGMHAWRQQGFPQIS